MNGLNSGTRTQEDLVKGAPKGEAGQYDYELACDYLKKLGFYEDCGYKYGHAWLVEIIPVEIIEEIKSW